ncbi:MAG: pesticidal protein Cry7Aa [Candidatus Liptonbacteria bacterium]|nr:pesticidal protein Cry7Aa [Candidatus Liptonbacteria bacterium]
MIKVKKLGVILEPTKIPFESQAVLNPGTYQEGKFVHLFYRAIDKRNHSCIGYAKLDGPTKVVERSRRPIVRRNFNYEKKGVEDPRIVKIGNIFYLLYVAHDGKNALTAYATSHDLKHFKKHGVVSAQITYHEAERIFKKNPRLKDAYFFFASFYEQFAGQDVLLWEKDFLLFPKKIRGQFALVHRVLPDMQIVFFKKFSDLTNNFWRQYLKDLSKHVILEGKHWFESRNIGGGAPPIETKAGWLLILHSVEELNRGRVYHASAALLDKNNPEKLIGRLHEPLFSPTKPWEKSGVVSNVVFPTGTALFGDTLYIYYGAADKRIGVASVDINDLIREIKNPKGHHKKSLT